jgi:uncharacterized protein YkwD
MLGLLALAAAPAQAQTRPQRMPGFHPVEPAPSYVEADLIDRTNAFRAEHGLGALTENPVLTDEARAFADYLARTGEFAHTAGGRTSAERAEAAGYDYCELAENLAYEEDSGDFRGRDLAADLMRGWEASPGHRHNLLIPDVVEIGVGVARSPSRLPRYVAVQVVGRPAAMRYAFEVINRTSSPISYAFEGRTWRIQPRMTITHHTCAPGDLTFQAPGPAGRSAYAARPGEAYVLEWAPGEGLVVEIMRRRA